MSRCSVILEGILKIHHPNFLLLSVVTEKSCNWSKEIPPRTVYFMYTITYQYVFTLSYQYRCHLLFYSIYILRVGDNSSQWAFSGINQRMEQKSFWICYAQPQEWNWLFGTNSDFLIPISLQPNFVDLRYFKLWIFLDQII